MASFLYLLLASSFTVASALPSQDSLLHDQPSNSSSKCKCYARERYWPPVALWNVLNATVDGNLRHVVPPAAVCYNTFEGESTYNASACFYVTAN